MSGPVVSVEVTVRLDPASLAAIAELARALMAAPAASPRPEPAPAQEMPQPAVIGSRAGEEQGAVVEALRPPPPTVSAPKAMTAADVISRRGAVWTDERKALLAELYPCGTALDVILERLNALPGPAVPNKDNIGVQAFNLGIKRNVTAREAAKAAAPTFRPDLPPVPRPLQPDHVTVAYSTAFAWAGERGLASTRGGMDIEAVNRKRRELGLPPFVISRPNVVAQRPMAAE